MRLEKILCPTDFSPGAKHASEVAARHAKAANAELVLAHAYFAPPLATEPEYPLPAPLEQNLAAECKQVLARAADELASQGARVTTAFLVGPPWDRIVSVLRDDPNFGLVVLGTHGRSALGRVLLGSVAEKVVRHAPCPVMVTRGEHLGPTYRHVLCPVDFSAASRAAVDLATQLVDPAGSLTLLYVIELPIAFDRRASMTEFLRDLDARSTRLISELAADVRERGPALVKTAVRIGGAGTQTLAALEEDPYDLVVLGSHGRTGLKRAMLGSVAEKVVRHAPCTVVVARSRD